MVPGTVGRGVRYGYSTVPWNLTPLISTMPMMDYFIQEVPVLVVVSPKFSNNILLFNEIRKLEKQANSANGNRARHLRLQVMSLKQQLKLLEDK